MPFCPFRLFRSFLGICAASAILVLTLADSIRAESASSYDRCRHWKAGFEGLDGSAYSYGLYSYGLYSYGIGRLVSKDSTGPHIVVAYTVYGLYILMAYI